MRPTIVASSPAADIAARVVDACVIRAAPRLNGALAANILSGMGEWSSRHSEAPDPAPQAWCVCGEKVTIADAREVTLPNGRPGWEGYCSECGAPLFAIRRKPAGG